MAFRMTGRVYFTDLSDPQKRVLSGVGHSLKWRNSVSNYCNTAEIVMPGICRLPPHYYNSKVNGEETIPTNMFIRAGMHVEIRCGYNGKNPLRFSGFVVNNGTKDNRLVVSCEGYSYQLRKKEGYSASYASVTVKQLLIDLVAGTNIKLSDKIPDIPLKNIYFKNVRGIDVLEYLRDKCLLSVQFNFEELYVGLAQGIKKGTAKFQIGWNVIGNHDLKFVESQEQAKVNIQISTKDKTGAKQRVVTKIKDGLVKEIKIRHIKEELVLSKIAEEQRVNLTYSGYQGDITGFLVPYVEPGMSVEIIDKKFPDRQGLYFVDTVEGSFSPSGGRQKIHITNRLTTN